MPIPITPITVSNASINTLPTSLPDPPVGSSDELMAYHDGMVEWYANFLIAYQTQQGQLLLNRTKAAQ